MIRTDLFFLFFFVYVVFTPSNFKSVFQCITALVCTN